MSPGGFVPVAELLATGALEQVPPNPVAIGGWLNDAASHVRSARAIAADDPRLALCACHDGVRKAITAHISHRGYRATGGPGAYQTVVAYAHDRLSAILDRADLEEIDPLRRARHNAEYGELASQAIDAKLVEAMIPVADRIVRAITEDIAGPRPRPRR